jgi:hypothetical protein
VRIVVDSATGVRYIRSCAEQKWKVMMPRRRFLVCWLPSAVLMFGLSYAWHGLALRDLETLRVPLTLYFVLAGIVYLLVAAVLTVGIDRAILHNVVALKSGFPFKAMGLGALLGFMVYLMVFILGMSFTSHGAVHIVVDVLWQMLEQGLGGMMVSFGIIYDMHRAFLEAEK